MKSKVCRFFCSALTTVVVATTVTTGNLFELGNQKTVLADLNPAAISTGTWDAMSDIPD